MAFNIGDIIANMSKKAVKGLSNNKSNNALTALNANLSSMNSIGSGKPKINYGYTPYTNSTGNLRDAVGQIGSREGNLAPRNNGGNLNDGNMRQLLSGGAIRGWGGSNNIEGSYDPLIQKQRNSGTSSYDPITQRNRNADTGGVGNAIRNGAGGLLGGLLGNNPGNASFNVPNGGDSGIGGMDANGSYSDQGAYPTTAPVTETYTPPEIKAKDFTDKANGMAAKAYQPFYDSILKGKANATQQANTSDEIVKGLYASLVADTQKSGQAQAAQYDQSSQQAAAQSAALQARQGQIYDDSAQSQAALLKSLGQEASAGQLLSGNSSDKAFQQSEAAAGGQAQQDYYAQQKQGAQDQTTGTANAQRTTGTVARENLIRDLGSVLSQFDSQSADGKTQEGTTALDLANQLTQTDLSNQQANAQNQASAFGMNQNAQQAALQNQQGAWDRQYQMNQDQQNTALQQAQLGYQQSQDAAKTAYQQEQDRQDQANKDRQYGLDENQFKIDAAAQQAKVNGQGASPSPTAGGFIPQGEQGYANQSGPQQVAATVAAIPNAGDPNAYIGLFNKIVASIDLNQFNGQSFARKAAEDAGNNGLSPAAAYAAATTFWNKVMNRS